MQERLGIGHKGVTADGLFSLEEVECIGVCCWAPALQVNYDFHDDLTNEKVDDLLASYRAKGRYDQVEGMKTAEGGTTHA